MRGGSEFQSEIAEGTKENYVVVLEKGAGEGITMFNGG